jgi:hypothetical protein
MRCPPQTEINAHGGLFTRMARGPFVALAQRNTVAQYQGLSRCKISHIRARYRLMPRNVDAVPYSMAAIIACILVPIPTPEAPLREPWLSEFEEMT